jgi:hypothetical protein
LTARKPSAEQRFSSSAVGLGWQGEGSGQVRPLSSSNDYQAQAMTDRQGGALDNKRGYLDKCSLEESIKD